jgi:hypothetical protein
MAVPMAHLQPLCIVWVRGEDEGIECRAAHDFGTAPINIQAQNSLSGVNEDPPLPIPFVPADKQYVVPTPDRRHIADRNAQVVEILASTITVNAFALLVASRIP